MNCMKPSPYMSKALIWIKVKISTEQSNMIISYFFNVKDVLIIFKNNGPYQLSDITRYCANFNYIRAKKRQLLCTSRSKKFSLIIVSM